MNKIIELKCPSCSAPIKADDNQEYTYCQYCGSKIQLVQPKEDNTFTFRHVDEAKIRESENEKYLKMKELEAEEKFEKRDSIKKFFIYALAFVLFIAGLLLFDSNGMMGMYLILAGMVIAELTWIGKDKKKKERKDKILLKDPNNIQLNDSVCYDENTDYRTLENRYKSLGFTNIELLGLFDLNFLQKWKNGKVERVTINGKDFEYDDVISKESKIVITYHCMNK